MLLNKIITTFQTSVLRNHIDDSLHALWIGAQSFEERCTGSLLDLEKNNIHFSKGMAFNYRTQVKPTLEYKQLREKNLRVILNLQKKVCTEGIMQQDIDPYSFQEIQNSVKSIIIDSKSEFVIFDITCMTKVHSLAIAALLAQWQYNFKWAVSYTIPENYIFEDPTKAAGWRDVIIAPLAETALLFNERHSRGIIIPGHEADRLIVALAEIEPSGGIILISATQNRPDLRNVTNRRNQKVVRQLTKMRSSNWETQDIEIKELDILTKYITNEVSLAKKYGAPLIFFPYGPKSLLFFTAYQLSLLYPESSWFVYPIPFSYNVNYSEGIEKTMWIIPEFRERL